MNKYVIYNILYLYIMELKSDSSVIIINSIGKYSNNHPRVEFKRGDVQIGNLIVQDSSIFFGKEDGNTLDNARHNVGIGIKSLNSLTTGSNNTVIGHNADVSDSTAINQIVIGAGAKGKGDNSIIVGDLFSISNGSLKLGDSTLYNNKDSLFEILNTSKTLYVTDNKKLRKIDIATKEVTTVYTGSSTINAITDVFGEIFIFDYTEKQVVKFDAVNNKMIPITKKNICGNSLQVYMTTYYETQNGNKFFDKNKKDAIIYLLCYTGTSGTGKILQIDPNGNGTSTPTTIYDPGTFNPIALLRIKDNIYITEHGQNFIKKLPINSDGTAGTINTFSTINSVTFSSTTYSNNLNKGGLTNIGDDIYYGAESYDGSLSKGLIFKIPTTGTSAGQAEYVKEFNFPGPLVIGFYPHKLSNDGTNLYTRGITIAIGATGTLKYEIHKLLINKNGEMSLQDFVGNNQGYNDAIGTSALFHTIEDITPIFDFQGLNNIGIGDRALYNNKFGKNNIAFGLKAGELSKTGTSNIIIGANADIDKDTGVNQIVIGAGAKGKGNNTVVLGDSLTIETTYLHGNIDINRAYILPKTAGTKGQVLKYPESGNTLEWDVGGGAGQSAGNVQIGDSSLYTSIANGPFEIFDGFYVADTQNNNIRKVTIDGVVSTLSLTKLDAAWKPKSLVYLDNNIYILNTNMARIEKLNISTNGLTQITQNNGLTNVIEITTDGTYLYALYNFLGTHYIYRIGLDGNSTTGIPPPWFPDGPSSGLSNPVGIIHINNNLYISESSTSKIKKLDIATKTLDDNFASLPSADSYGRNGGGLISIGTDIYYGCTQTYKIFKIPTTGSSAGTATALQQSSSDFSLTFAPYRLSHDGTNLYAWDNPTSSHQIFKIPINNDGTVGTVVSFVGSSSSGSANGTGSSAQFDKPHSMIPVIKNIIGKNNIAIGEKALYSNTIGTDNIALGHKAGDLIKTGNLNVIIGSDADVSNSTAINQIVIGAGAKGIGDNTVILGDSLTIQKTRLNGNIGINTSHPDRHLHVTSSESGKTVHIKCESSYADRNHIQLGATGTSYNRIYSRKMYGTTVKECKLLIETGDNDTGTGNIIMQFCPDFSGGTGHVGINVPKGIDPGVPLYVQGKNGVVSIKAEGTILGSQTTPSDRRIKENIHEINDNSALKKLRSIECYYYNYIDKEGRGYDSVVGFIAQEVKEYLPMAVNLIKDTIPNEMRKIENPQWTELSPKSFKLTIPDLEDVSANTKYKFNMRQDSSSPIKNAQSSTMEGDPKSFLFERKYNEVFLYGKEVNDFHTLAKDKLFALNFSASQELDRVQQQEKTKLQAAEAKIALLETENTQLKADIAAIKSHLGI
jgi:hypothetical protein